MEQRASLILSRSGYGDVVSDAGLVARRPTINDPEIVFAGDSFSSYVGGELLRPGSRSAPAIATKSGGVDDPFVAAHHGKGHVSVAPAGDRQRLSWPHDDQFRRPDDGHGGAQSNPFVTTTCPSYFRVTSRRDADHRLCGDDATDDVISAVTRPDRSADSCGNVNDPRPSPGDEIDSAADLVDGYADPDPRDVVDTAAGGRPTDQSGRPAVGATGTYNGNIALSG